MVVIVSVENVDNFAEIAPRFWAKVQRGKGCWLWQGATFGSRNYGAFNWADKRPGYAHRFSYELHFGPIPDGRVVMHTCDTPACVRPDHLRLGSQRQNIRDAVEKGRWHSEARRAYYESQERVLVWEDGKLPEEHESYKPYRRPGAGHTLDGERAEPLQRRDDDQPPHDEPA